jgi:hypothetical protein
MVLILVELQLMQNLSTNGVSVTFVYVDATQGWIVTDSGNRSDLPHQNIL